MNKRNLIMEAAVRSTLQPKEIYWSYGKIAVMLHPEILTALQPYRQFGMVGAV